MYSVYHFLWCKYSYCDLIQVTNVPSLTAKLRSVLPNITGLQHTYHGVT